MHEIPVMFRVRQRAPYLVIGLVCVGIGIASAATGGSAALVPVGAIFVALFFVSASWGIVLTRDGLTRKVGLPARIVRWHEIERIDAPRRLGGTTVKLTLMSGRRVRLPTPVSGKRSGDPDFDAALATILLWWSAANKRMTAEEAELEARRAGLPAFPG